MNLRSFRWFLNYSSMKSVRELGKIDIICRHNLAF